VASYWPRLCPIWTVWTRITFTNERLAEHPKRDRPRVTAVRVSKFHGIGSKPYSLLSWAAFQLPPLTDRSSGGEPASRWPREGT
jgi:hypothetical protein